MGLITTDHTKRWPGGCVIWRFHQAMSDAEKATLRRAMEIWQEGDRDVRFVERTVQSSYVTLTPDGDVDGVNHSDVGMIGGEQHLWLEPITADSSRLRPAQHELGHTLGFHHEHVRCDRDTFVKIDMSKIPLLRYFDYDKQCGSGWRMVGDYDFSSIMHYRPRTTTTNDNSVDIQAVDPADTVALRRRKDISAVDSTALAELHGGNAHVYQLAANGQIEKTVRQYAWPNGWSEVTPFGVGPLRFVLLLRGSDGRVVVRSAAFDGSLSDVVDEHNWSSGWSSATVYAIGPFTYLMLYKRSSGTRHINRINANGTIGAQAVAGVQIESGWTSIRRYTVGLHNFLIYANSASGAMRVRRIDWDGTEGEPIQTWSEPPGWTTVEPYQVEGSQYLLLLRATTGETQVRRIHGNGTIASSGSHTTLSAGWSSAQPCEVAGKTYLFLCNKVTGDVRIRRLAGNGTVGTTTDRRKFGPGWAMARCYPAGLGTFLVLVAP